MKWGIIKGKRCIGFEILLRITFTGRYNGETPLEVFNGSIASPVRWQVTY